MRLRLIFHLLTENTWSVTLSKWKNNKIKEIKKRATDSEHQLAVSVATDLCIIVVAIKKELTDCRLYFRVLTVIIPIFRFSCMSFFKYGFMKMIEVIRSILWHAIIDLVLTNYLENYINYLSWNMTNHSLHPILNFCV